MTRLSTLQGKKTKTVIGLMSGTSVNSIDAALVRITGTGTQTRLRLLAFRQYPVSVELRTMIVDNSLPGKGSVDTLCRINAALARCFADAALRVAAAASVPIRSVDLIGSHGQTVHHLPGAPPLLGIPSRSTLQLGDPSAIAVLTGVTTVGDFRQADVAAGGQGAPLVPYFDFVTLRSRSRNRLVLNLGGIANVTLLPRGCRGEDVVAFDTGPANMLIDLLTQKFFGKPFDRNGAIARRGRVVPELLRWMMSHPYYLVPPPKSTGRELFGQSYARDIVRRSHGARAEDILATATELTALSVYDQYVRFLRRQAAVDEVIVSGGGRFNRTLVRSLREHFAPAVVQPSDKFGLPADAKEAICFALLANETIAEHPTNLRRVTGASRNVILGKICFGR